MTELSQVSVTALKGVGEAMAEKLAKVGLENPGRAVSPAAALPGSHPRGADRCLRPGQDAVIEGTVSGADVVMGRRRSLVVRLQDGTGG
jgi:ATP-dependent DNA helicase RecG